MRICPKALNVAIAGSTFYQALKNKPTKVCRRFLKFYQVAKVPQIWSHWAVGRLCSRKNKKGNHELVQMLKKYCN